MNKAMPPKTNHTHFVPFLHNAHLSSSVYFYIPTSAKKQKQKEMQNMKHNTVQNSAWRQKE
jgi:hypothetical protein